MAKCPFERLFQIRLPNLYVTLRLVQPLFGKHVTGNAFVPDNRCASYKQL